MDTQALLEHLKAAREALAQGQSHQALIWLEAVRDAGYMEQTLAALIERASLHPDDMSIISEIDALLGRLGAAEEAVDAIESLEELPEDDDWFGLEDAPIEGMDAPALERGIEDDLFSDLDANSSPESFDFEELESLDVPATLSAGAQAPLFEELELEPTSEEGAAFSLEGWDLEAALADAPAPEPSAPSVFAPDALSEPQPEPPAAAPPRSTPSKGVAALGSSLFDEEEDDPFLDASRPLEARSQPDIEPEAPAARPSYTFFDELSSRHSAPSDFLPDLDPAEEPPQEEEEDALASLGSQMSTRQGDEDLSLAELLAREPAAARERSPDFSLNELFDELDLGFLPEAAAPAPQPAQPAAPAAPDVLLAPPAEDAGFEWGGADLFPDLPAERARLDHDEAPSHQGSSSKNPQRWLTTPPAAMTAEEEEFGDVTRIPGMTFAHRDPPAPLKQENPPTLEHSYEMAPSGDDFDFDLGPSRPTTKLPALAPSARAPQRDEEEDFDFDLGPSRPTHQVAAPVAAQPPAKPLRQTPAPAPADEFDFDLGLNMPQSSYHPPAGQEHSSSSSIRLTPAAPQTSISGFERQKTPPAGSPKQPTPGGADVTEDEFFALAESLAPRQLTPAPQPRPYRGEPMVRRGEPQPPEPAPARHNTGNLANPFAHDAPTGVRKALVEPSQGESPSQASFVLEEIEPADEPNTTSQIRKLYDEGKISQAWSRVETVALQEPDNTDVRQLRVKIEQEMERLQLRRLGPLSRIPHLSVAPSQLSTLNLDHRSGFLISQIDGTMCFEDILDLSSMSRLETLMVLADLLEKQIIKAS